MGIVVGLFTMLSTVLGGIATLVSSIKRSARKSKHRQIVGENLDILNGLKGNVSSAQYENISKLLWIEIDKHLQKLLSPPPTIRWKKILVASLIGQIPNLVFAFIYAFQQERQKIVLIIGILTTVTTSLLFLYSRPAWTCALNAHRKKFPRKSKRKPALTKQN